MCAGVCVYVLDLRDYKFSYKLLVDRRVCEIQEYNKFSVKIYGYEDMAVLITSLFPPS